jgi:hypothetical protein
MKDGTGEVGGHVAAHSSTYPFIHFIHLSPHPFAQQSPNPLSPKYLEPPGIGSRRLFLVVVGPVSAAYLGTRIGRLGDRVLTPGERHLLLLLFLGYFLRSLFLGHLLLRHCHTSIQGLVTELGPESPNSGRPPKSPVVTQKPNTFLATAAKRFQLLISDATARCHS